MTGFAPIRGLAAVCGAVALALTGTGAPAALAARAVDGSRAGAVTARVAYGGRGTTVALGARRDGRPPLHVTLRLSRAQIPVRSKVTVKGKVRPRVRGDRVVLQARQDGGKWHPVTTGRTNRAAKYRLHWRAGSPGEYLLRVRARAARTHRAGVSNTRRLTVVGSTTGVVATGAGHSCAIVNGGAVKCWGSNTYGQLGNGTTTSSLTPVTVTGITTATAITAGGERSCALLRDHTVRCWGRNSRGELGNGTTSDSDVPVPVSGITTATAVSTGLGPHTCALLADRTIRCWGYNNFGQLGNATTTDSSNPVSVTGIHTATAISAGGDHSCAVLSSGRVRCWGYNVYGQLGGKGAPGDSTVPVVVTGIHTATAVAAGGFHSCAALAERTVRCWGSNRFGQLGDTSTTDSTTPVAVDGITTASGAPAAGGNHACTVLTGLRVRCWGFNGFGQLGNATTTDSSTPVTVTGLAPVTAVSSGVGHSCAVSVSGRVSCWGHNISGQLGNGTTTDSDVPVAVVGLD